MTILLIFLLTIIIVFHSNLNKKLQGKHDGTKDVEIMVPLKYTSNFWRTLKMPLINCEVTLQLKLSAKCFLVAGTEQISWEHLQ